MLEGRSVRPMVTTRPAWKSAAGVLRRTRCGLTALLKTPNASKTDRMAIPRVRVATTPSAETGPPSRSPPSQLGRSAPGMVNRRWSP
ncbi:MAG: hypothetical protein C0506_09090 [Anaerolinea sp.]|nr:hypothetical protein [Anaerolinea sp.]